MTDGDHLYRAILAHPDEDTPRLAYADWLDENAGPVRCSDPRHDDPSWPAARCGGCGGRHGESDGRRERAEFIRVQCRLAFACVTCTPVCSQEYGHAPPCELGLVGDLRRRERELWAAHGKQWFPNPSGGEWRWHVGGWDTKHPDGPGWEITRGFVAEIRLTAAAFLGEVCAFCEGRGHFQSSGSYAECPRCRGPLGTGTGRTGGLAKELFSRHPIERVVLTDVRAICGARSNLYFTAIVDQNGFVTYPDQPPFPRKTYATAAECEADLSAALVAYGRDRAGLPPLPGIVPPALNSDPPAAR
jgi:uncharacterized protein (TIGR02996 family)